MKKQRILQSLWILFMVLCSAVPALAQSAAGEDAEDATDAFGVLAASPPIGQGARYLLPNYSSVAAGTTRSFTIITIFNGATVACDVGVQFQFAFGTTNLCSITGTIPPGESRLFCSRNPGKGITPCTNTCPSGGLTFNVGHAFVSSAANCASKMAVDAQVYYSDTADEVVGVSKLTIIKYNNKNSGD